MKKKLIMAIFIGFLFSACKKNFLDLAPNENITEAAAFSTMIQTENFVNNIYSSLPTPQSRAGGNVTFDCMSDEGAPTFSNDARTFNGGGYGPTNIATYIGNVWGNSFAGIRKANVLLDKLPNVPATNDEENATKIRLRGEALFMRAFLYFDLLKIYGRFPILTKVLTSADNFQIPRNTYDECVAFILKDLEEATSILPDSYPTNLLGRANKAMCKAVKSRLLLYAASPLNAVDNAGKWQAAAKAAKDVIDLNQFSLYNALANKADNYKAIFNVFANPEIIWFRNLGNVKLLEQLYYPPNGSGYGCESPTQNFVDEYQMANGKDITDPTSGYDAAKPYLNREPRFYATVWYNGSVLRGKAIQTYAGGTDAINAGSNNTKTGYYLRKKCDETVSLSSGPGRQAMSIWFRLAEFYLNYAEAANEAVVSPAADPLIYTYVNMIRTRAGLPNLSPGLTKDQMRLAIRHERRIELSFEEHRFFDDRRWKLTFGGNTKGIVWDAAGTSYTIITAENRAFNEKMWYMPIPQNEINIMKIDQNPGWQ